MTKLLLLVLALIVTSCGGGDTSVESFEVPKSAKFATSNSTPSEVVLHTYQALYGKAPSNSTLTTLAGQLSAVGGRSWTNSFAGSFSNLSTQEFCALVLKNLGFTPSTIVATTEYGSSQATYDALLAAYVQYMGLVGVENRGVVAAQVVSFLTDQPYYESYKFAQSRLIEQLKQNNAYSSNPLSTVDSVVSVTLTGRVVDGYIKGATVFWDCNNNGVKDLSEKSVVSATGGIYIIEQAPSTNCDLLAFVPANAVDEDNPSAPIGRSYTMAAPFGKYDVISPLTTLVAGALKSGEAASLSAADGLIASKFGLSGSMLIDFKAVTTDQTSKALAAFARLTAKELANQPSGIPIVQLITPTTASLVTANSTPGINASINLGITPFVFNPDPITSTYKQFGVQPSTKYRVIRNQNDSLNNALLDTIANTLNQAQAGEYGVVNFWKIPTPQLETWITQFDRTNISPEKDLMIKALQASRTASFAEATQAWNTTISTDIGFFNYLKDNPLKAADYALGIGSNAVNVAIDAVSLVSAGAPAALRDDVVRITAKKDRLIQLQKISGYFTDTSTCLIQTGDILIEIEKEVPSPSAIKLAIPKVISGCKDLLSNILKDAKVLRFKGKTKDDIARLLISKELVLIRKDLSLLQDAKSPDSAAVANLKVLMQLTEVYKDILSLVDGPAGPLATATAGVDLVIQYLDAYITGAELGDAVVASNAIIAATAQNRYNDEINRLYKTYFVSWLSVFSDYFKVVDPSIDPYITSVAYPSSGAQITISVTGKNLPLSSLTANLGGSNCQEIAGGTSTQRSFSCTTRPNTVASSFAVYSNGEAIPGSTGLIPVAPLVCNAGQFLYDGVCVGSSFATSISTDFGLTCASVASGGVRCWGDNNFGQLGNGTTTPRRTPGSVLFASVDRIINVSNSGFHSCGLTEGGGLKCWGYNESGQLGDGSSTAKYLPIDVQGLSIGVRAVVAANLHTCALTSVGGVKCWGANNYGQLGDGSGIDSKIPVNVQGLSSGVVALDSGAWHTCALLAVGSVKCWGHNDTGQLGDGTTIRRYSPVSVLGLTDRVTALSAGFMQTCSVSIGGGVKCWGYNRSGQLGDGTITDRYLPVNAQGLSSGVASVSVGGGFTCALTTTNGIKCWGDNSWGQLGNGSGTASRTPVNVQGLASGVRAMSSGYREACAILGSGSVRCWGNNESGQLGDGTTINRYAPVDVLGL